MNAVGADQQIGLQGHGFTVGPFEDPQRAAILAFETREPVAHRHGGGAEFLLHPGEQDALQRPPPEGNLGRRKAREAPPGLFPNLLPKAIKVGEGLGFHPRLKQGLGYPQGLQMRYGLR